MIDLVETFVFGIIFCGSSFELNDVTDLLILLL
jgi:hypothetical protein